MPADINNEFNVSSWLPDQNRPFVHKLSDGGKCLVRKIGLEDLIELGIVDKLDSLTAIVQNDHVDRVQGKRPQDRKKKQPTKAELEGKQHQDAKQTLRLIFGDSEQSAQMQELVNTIVMRAVIQPEIYSPIVETPDGPRVLDIDERDPKLAYIDYVPFTDRFSIFSAVFDSMGSLERFPEESE